MFDSGKVNFQLEPLSVRGYNGRPHRMQIAGFTFIVGDLDGYRFIETVFPAVFDRTRLWAAASSYPTFWDELHPTVTLNDIRAMGELDAEPQRVLRWVLQQNMVRARLLATSWVTGGNPLARSQIEAILREVGRPTNTVFESRDEAMDHLRAEIAAWRTST